MNPAQQNHLKGQANIGPHSQLTTIVPTSIQIDQQPSQTLIIPQSSFNQATLCLNPISNQITPAPSATWHPVAPVSHRFQFQEATIYLTGTTMLLISSMFRTLIFKQTLL